MGEKQHWVFSLCWVNLGAQTCTVSLPVSLDLSGRHWGPEEARWGWFLVCSSLSWDYVQMQSTHSEVCLTYIIIYISLVAQMVKNLPVMQEIRVLSLSWEDPLEKGMATHSTIFAWKIPRAKEPGRLFYSSGGEELKLKHFHGPLKVSWLQAWYLCVVDKSTLYLRLLIFKLLRILIIH